MIGTNKKTAQKDGRKEVHALNKTSTIRLKPFILYLEDLEEINALLKSGGHDLRYYVYDKDDTYTFDSLEELLAQLKGQVIYNLSIYIPSSSLSINLASSPSIIIGGDSYALKGQAYTIKEICSRHPYYRSRFFQSIWPIIISGIMAFAIIVVKPKLDWIPEELSVSFSILCALINMYFLYSYLKYSTQRKGDCKTYLYYNKDKPKSIFKPNKDRIWDIVKIVLTAIITWIISKF